MTRKTAILFGSIGTLVETSDIQRRSYNQALAEAGLDWNWDVETYAMLLEQSGGKERLAMLAAATGRRLDPVTIEQVHARKTELATAEVVASRPPLRPGVEALAMHARQAGRSLGFVTTTYRPNVDAVLQVAPTLAFDVIVTRDDVSRGKPHPECYLVAMGKLGITADQALAIEDTAASVMAARRAGVRTIATPGAFARGQDFWQADLVLDSLAGGDGTLDPRIDDLLPG